MSETKTESTQRLFGTDGVRGTANVHPMTPEVAMALGQAIASHLRAGPQRHRIIIGKDTRISGYMLEQALAAGISSMGVDVMLCGPLPTPAVAFLTHSMRADAGAVISASHNPYPDNGIKFFRRDGFKLPDEVEDQLEAFVLGGAGDTLSHRRPTAGRVGKAYRIDDARGRYIGQLKSRFPADQTLDGMRVVVDCAHGAAYKIAPSVYEELGAKVTALGVAPDGRNINKRAGALHPEQMARKVKRQGAHIGVALDGDADRLVIADEKGRVVDGDAVMAALARHLISKRQLKKKTLVATVMSNLGLDESLAEVGGRVVRTPVGDRNVVERMRKSGLNLGGEQSGHLVFLDHATTGDGTLAGLMVMAMMVETGRPLSELMDCLEPYPQVQHSLMVSEKPALESLAGYVKAQRSVEKKLAGKGRVLVRYSGTEPKVRVLVEARKAALAETCASTLVDALTSAIGA